ncbi:arginase family protein [Solilutibacter silvestris]|uniref:Arginase family n=1 Tax=Solilutibacter silvestris TaxID=1645665 RepID=A0A2K1Q224_9GAMM|nr:arginase family protein [Lysobacter silvestris]PNS09083.1 Arginase family [Lysobacter silvestris]
MSVPLILDLDDSVRDIGSADRLPLQQWQERLRFSCSRRDLRRFGAAIAPVLMAVHGTVLMGSGDFHHLSLPLVEREARRRPLRVVVLDNHPDNMRFPFGVHCGSWVGRAAKLPGVVDVHVLGISSLDAGRGHAWENQLGALRSGRVHYWCVGVDTEWARRFGIATVHSFESPEELVAAFVRQVKDDEMPVYFSVDKDVFAPDVVRTNWDQGKFQLDDALTIIAALKSRIVASDITGEVSIHRYRSLFKRLLSALDQQPDPSPDEIEAWQQQQAVVNRALIAALGW